MAHAMCAPRKCATVQRGAMLSPAAFKGCAVCDHVCPLPRNAVQGPERATKVSLSKKVKVRQEWPPAL